MATIQIEPNLKIKTDKVLNGIAQMNLSDIEEFLSQVSNVLAKKKAPNLSARESELLLAINKPWTDKKTARFKILIKKLQDETLSEKEHTEYMKLVNERQDRSIERLKNLIELAAIRNISVSELSEQLGIHSPS